MDLKKFTRLITTSSKKAGLEPGTLVHVGIQRTDKIRIRRVQYGEMAVKEVEIADPKDVAEGIDPALVTWVNVEGVHHPEAIEKIGAAFKLHSLTLEDILNTAHRTKLDDYDLYLFLVLKMFRHPIAGTSESGIQSDQICLVLGKGFVLSFCEKPEPVLDPILKRIQKAAGRIRKMGADYLFGSILDAVVDSYFVILEDIAQSLEAFEEHILSDLNVEILTSTNQWKKELLFLRKSIWPLKEILNDLSAEDDEFTSESILIYLRDVNDHVSNVMETIEILQEILARALDTHLSLLNSQTNKVIKVLTILTAVFMPMTFITGLFGMNHHYIPGIGWRWGFYSVLIVMAGIAGIMLIFFRKKRWI